MYDSPDSIRAALLLTNRLVQLDAKPLAAKEFWTLVARIDPGHLLHLDIDELGEALDVDPDGARRLRTLLDAATSLVFEEERLLDGGVSLISALDRRFPSSLRERLGTSCPPFLLVAGPEAWLHRPGLGIVGSRDADEDALAAARQAAVLGVGEGWPVVSGLARGVDQVAIAAALDSGGSVVGIPAEGIRGVSRNPEIRGRVHAGELCIATPYAPDAPFRPGNAMGRNKLIYALSRVTFVVSANDGSGGTWAGAKEALHRHYGPVAVWVGAGAREGNDALVRRGASPITEVSGLFDRDVDQQPARLQRALF
jgi:predicted Rossmann fold nucleotide-binding protein DprA/Smf involved in DNA uptake